ncbi:MULTISPECIES: arginine N-succinyltransferase [unclassified Agarivorans]|uniref:arginine N-succinyltransferase n=1 Tax=unclassified Agarivorans TaxID=2636026 RepID=UPI0010EB1952|nr:MULTISPECIES: arginine N-succinyltransferase [unclassified Agarivorans]MDO6765429.1 arginine N-succinyltransferase [Agarivorans sp. 1_MG-2023]GDY26759.1 arginine N-succinyltransferase [Agarivorans sp. Toyoura001]
MLVIRPIKETDYPALLQMAVGSGIGFTSLPVDEPLLREKLAHSIRSFATDTDKPGDQHYLMVAEDTVTGEVVGTSAIDAAVGMSSPFYTYHLGKVVHASRSLNVYNVVETLTLTNDYTGVTELCTLFLQESHRQGQNGRLLSKCRFLLMAEHQERFNESVIAEMRGVSDEQGRSPFWQWLQDSFFSVDFPTADYLTGVGKKEFIAELMPKYPIYVNLLSKEAQAVIGEVHEKTRPALRLLEAEGFCKHGYVDIFDAGPTVECPLKLIESVKHSFKLKIRIGQPSDAAEEMLLTNARLQDFRACVSAIDINLQQQTALISPEAANALLVNEGASIRVGALRFEQ